MAERDGPVGSPLGILVVEDQDAVRQLFGHALTAYGFRVVAAATGEKAVEVFGARRTEIAVALIDVCLPGMSGPETLARLRQARPGLPALFMTGGGIRDYTHELDGHDVDVWVKPFSMARVADHLARLARGETRPS
jgi:two-component system cell cycle sensor histidine kinase/response regulator CckA